MQVNQNNIIWKAIKLINNNATWSIVNNDLDTIVWLDGTTPIPKEDIEARLSEAETALNNENTAKADLKASAKAKLISGEALTEEEANTIVL